MASFTRSYGKSSKDLRSRSAGVVVCGCSSQVSPFSPPFSSLFVFFLLISAKPTFSVASGGSSTTSPPIKSPPSLTGIRHGHLILLALLGFLLGCILLLMAYFMCVRLGGKGGKSKMGIGRDQVLPTTHEPLDGTGELSKSAPLDLGKELAWRFGWKEIERAGKNFSWVVGEGGYSTVYLARFSDSTLGALKMYRGSERLNQVFQQELQVLIQVSHKNIVRLLGYCDEREEGVLVFEYISNGTLHEKLHGRGPTTPPLPWSLRMSIAFQLAQAIEYLHENCSLQIVHCDLKASNILLDDQFNCKLCDFGSAKMGFSSTVLPSPATAMMGSPGYADPHYLRTGIISKKTDVYSFGVLVLELITGIEAFCEEKGQFLTSLLGSALNEPRKVVEMADARLGGEFDREEAMTMASIAAACLSQQPSLRPSMGEILRTMEEKITRIDFVPGKPKVIH